jgi:hypothetical protein
MEYKKNILKFISSSLKEVVFIVFGILIALYIDNWDDNRKKIADAKEFIQDIKTDLKRDTSLFGEEIRRIELYNVYQKSLLENPLFLDSLTSEDFISIMAGGYHNIKINNATFNRMKESDIFHLNKYETLFKKYFLYYTFQNTYLGNVNDWEIRMYDKSMLYLTFQNNIEVSFNDSLKIYQSEKVRKQSIKTLLNSVEGRNNFKLIYIREKTMKNTYERIYNSAIKLLIQTDSLTIAK